MQVLNEQFIEQCPVENGFRLRGEAMTRIEVFVDAAFAFAVTMLVISIDQTPRSVQELMAISKSIPAFILSVALLAYIWHHHSIWSKRFGMEDGKTVLLSVALVMVVLVFMYPLKMMFSDLFSWITNGYLPSQYVITRYEELRFMFIFFAIGFALISFLFMTFYNHALRYKVELKLSAIEVHNTGSDKIFLIAMLMICLLALLLSMTVPGQWIPYTGFVYVLNWPLGYWIQYRRNRQWNTSQSNVKPIN